MLLIAMREELVGKVVHRD